MINVHTASEHCKHRETCEYRPKGYECIKCQRNPEKQTCSKETMVTTEETPVMDAEGVLELEMIESAEEVSSCVQRVCKGVGIGCLLLSVGIPVLILIVLGALTYNYIIG